MERLEFPLNDDSLLAVMEDLFKAGKQEIELQHPSGESIIVTKGNFDRLKPRIRRAVRLRKRLWWRERRKRGEQGLAALIGAAEVREIKANTPVGMDVHGNKFDIEGMDFVPLESYKKFLIEPVPGEFGCMMDRTYRKAPVRLRTV